MNELVFLQDNQALTTSRTVAEYFEKEHRHVMEAIRSLIAQAGGMPKIGQTSVFTETTYINEQNGQAYPMYLINRDGFSLLAMGFTGAKALQFKLKFIAAFNAMEKQLTQRPKVPTPFADKITDLGETARALEKYITGLKGGMALAQAIAFAEANDGLNYEPIKKLLPPAEHETGYLNATQVGEKLGLGKGNIAGRKANGKLKDAGFQYKDGQSWRLTDEGTAYGEELPYSRNGHSDYQIRWNVSIIDALSTTT